jgi:glycosyltransferase involved in cell wall biosynthesis
MEEGLRIAVLGTRGIPEVMGGVERHCQELYPRLVELGCRVTVFGRAPYLNGGPPSYKGVRVVPLRCPRTRSLEAIVHTLRGVLRVAARSDQFDLLHLHGIGPALFAPLARALGLRVIVTNHGPDYVRAKWGPLAQAVLRLGERLGARFSHGTIAVSQGIADDLTARLGVQARHIPNGVNHPEAVPPGPYLASLGLTRRRYVLAVARLVPEKGLHDLLAAFRPLDTDWKLAIAGGADHESSYSRDLREMAAMDPRVVMTGFIKGRQLGEVYSNAGLFVLPSYHEGLPIVLLEALSYGLPVLASAIGANLEVVSQTELTFRPGDTAALRQRLEAMLRALGNGGGVPRPGPETLKPYDWDEIARQTLAVYEERAMCGRTNE